MYAQVRQLTSGIASSQEIMDRLVSDLLPIYESSPGFVSYSVVDVYTNGVVTIRVFDDAQALEDAVEAARSAQEQLGADLQIDASLDELGGEVPIDVRA